VTTKVQQTTQLKSEMQQRAGAVIQARRDLDEYTARYGRNSGGAADRRRRLKAAEKALMDLTLQLFGGAS
jgi:hypothetical protein